MVHGLSRRELRHRREDTISIACEEKDGVGVVAQRLGLVVWNVINWVRHATVLSLLGVEVIHFLGHWIDGDVLKESIALDGSEDIWFSFFSQINGLGVASSFKVEDSLVIPSMLIVTNELAATRKDQMTEEGGGILTVGQQRE